jgi:hypothetical protein
MDDKEYELLRWKAFELAMPTVSKADIDKARADKRMAISLKVSVDVMGDEIRHAALKIVFPDKTEETLLLDPVATQVLSDQLSHLLGLGWRIDALKPKGPAH